MNVTFPTVPESIIAPFGTPIDAGLVRIVNSESLDPGLVEDPADPIRGAVDN